MVRGLEDIARGWGFEKVWLTVEAVNRPARQLYRKLGYKSMQSATQVRQRAESTRSPMQLYKSEPNP